MTAPATWSPGRVVALGWRRLPLPGVCDTCGALAPFGQGGPGMVRACYDCITGGACAGCGGPLLAEGGCSGQCGAEMAP